MHGRIPTCMIIGINHYPYIKLLEVVQLKKKEDKRPTFYMYGIPIEFDVKNAEEIRII